MYISMGNIYSLSGDGEEAYNRPRLTIIKANLTCLPQVLKVK